MPTASESLVSAEAAPPPNKKKRLGSLFKKSRSDGQSPFLTSHERVKIELNTYLQSTQSDAESDPLQWWPSQERNFPILAALAKKYLFICATSTSSERLFSTSGSIVTPRRSCLKPDMVNMLCVLVNMCALMYCFEYTTYFVLIRLQKAYDTVWRDGLWLKLWDMGVKGRMWCVIKKMYEASRSTVLLEGEKSAMFSVEQGVAQGCSLSPILFSVFINDLLKDVEQAELGIQLSSGKRVGGMLFADDFVGVSDSRESLQKLIDVIHGYCIEWRLKVLDNGRKKVNQLRSVISNRDINLSARRLLLTLGAHAQRGLQ